VLSYCKVRSWETFLLSSNLIELFGRIVVRYCSWSLAAWLTMVVALVERVILVRISCRLFKALYCEKSMLQMPSFKAVNSHKAWEVVAMLVVM